MELGNPDKQRIGTIMSDLPTVHRDRTTDILRLPADQKFLHNDIPCLRLAQILRWLRLDKVFCRFHERIHPAEFVLCSRSCPFIPEDAEYTASASCQHPESGTIPHAVFTNLCYLWHELQRGWQQCVAGRAAKRCQITTLERARDVVYVDMRLVRQLVIKPVSVQCADALSWLYQQIQKAAPVADGRQYFSYASGALWRAAIDERRNVCPEMDSRFKQLGAPQRVSMHFVERKKDGSGVAAAAAHPGTCRDALLDSDDGTGTNARCTKEGFRSGTQNVLIVRDAWTVYFDRICRDNVQVVAERNLLDNCVEQVVPVRPSAGYVKCEIQLRMCFPFHAWQKVYHSLPMC